MIELDVNGQRSSLAPDSPAALRDALAHRLAADHVICSFRVNGREIPESCLEDFEVAAIRTLEVTSAAPRDLARGAIAETGAWIQRIYGVLDAAARHFRTGRTKEAADLLVSVTEALQVLVSLLRGIHQFVELDAEVRRGIDEPWREAELELAESIAGLCSDLDRNDPVRLADRAGSGLPRSLARFQELLERIEP